MVMGKSEGTKLHERQRLMYEKLTFIQTFSLNYILQCYLLYVQVSKLIR